MARTKQTARMSMAQGAMRGKGGKGVGGKGLVSSRKTIFKPARNAASKKSRTFSFESQQSVDINVQQFSVRFDNQKECQTKAIPYYVVQCYNCSAYLNSHSTVTESQPASQSILSSRSTKTKKLSDQKQQELKNSVNKLWECQFCLSNNLLPKCFVSIPPENPCYLISKGQINADPKQKGQKLIIYCIDVSGSMQTNVQNKTRIAAVRQAIADQIKRMKFQQQKVKIGIITFGSEVSVYTNTGNKNIPNITYYNFDNLLIQAKKIKGFASSINTQFTKLVQNVQKLTTWGSTALGPALVTALELSSSGPKGSKIILCTDGESNVGINGPQFYTKAAAFAKQRGVVVNILSLKGDNCNLKELGKLTLSTGGSILKIDAKLLGSEFNKISKEQILGVQSNLKIKVNHIYQIENALPNSLSSDKTIMTQDYGSFSAQTELTFNFKTLHKEQVQAKGFNNKLAQKQKAYMQIQLIYTSTDGSKYLQVITDYRQFTLNKQDLTKELNFGLFSASQLQKISALIKDEKLPAARSQIDYYHSVVEQTFRKIQKQSQINKFENKISTLTRILKSKELKQQQRFKPRKQLVAQKIARITAPTTTGLNAFKGRVGTKRTSQFRHNPKSNVSMSGDNDEQEEQNDILMMQSDSQEMHLCDFKRARSVDNDLD